MRILETLSYCFNPFDSSQHSLEQIKALGRAERFFVLFSTAIATILTVGLGTLAVFRLLTHTFTLKKSEERSVKEQRVQRTSQAVLTRKEEPLPTSPLLPQKTPSPPLPAPLQHQPPHEEEAMTIEELFGGQDTELEIDLVHNGIDFSEARDLYIPSPPGDSATRTVSKETEANKAALRAYIEENSLGSLGQADDTGDCFYDSVARLLTWHAKKRGEPEKIFSKKEIRKAIGSYLANIKDPERLRKLDRIYEEEGGFAAYMNQVRLTHENIIQLQEEYRTVALQVNEKRAKIRELIVNDADEEIVDQAVEAFKNWQEELARSGKLTKPPPAPTWGGEGDKEILKEIYGFRIWILHSQLVRQKAENPYIMSAEDQPDLPILWLALSARLVGSHFDPIIPPES